MTVDKAVKEKIFQKGLLGTFLVVIVVLSGIFIVDIFPKSNNDYTPQFLPFGTYDFFDSTLQFYPNITEFNLSTGEIENIIEKFELYMERTGLNATERAKDLLIKNGFVVIPTSYSDVYNIYGENWVFRIPNFITVDSVLHIYHLLLDKCLRFIEGDILRPMLFDLTEIMIKITKSQYNSAFNPNVKEAARRNLAFFSVAGYLLQPINIDPSVKNLVEAELKLIEAHNCIAISPILEYYEDYSQYTPRGHYTRAESLKQYFKAMMWYGRMKFNLMKGIPYIPAIKDINGTRQALLICLALKSSNNALRLWHTIFDVISFFAGSSDDLTYWDYLEAASHIYPQSLKPKDLANDTSIESFIDIALKYRNPRIISTLVLDFENETEVTKGFHFFGQRYSHDAYIFQSLVHDNVFNRTIPTALDILAVFGSSRAKEILVNESILYPDYLPQRNSIEQEFSKLNETSWTENLYNSWIYSLIPLQESKGEGYPFYMQSSAWLDKSLFTTLGSWTELKHDVGILYSKQSYSVSVTSGHPPGFVEPYPRVYARLASLTAMTLDGLEKRNILPNEIEDRIENLYTLLLNLTTISMKELENTPLTPQERDLIQQIHRKFKAISSFGTTEYTSSTDDRMAIVADVFSDPNTMQVLEEAVGNAFVIYTINPYGNGYYLTRGAVFSYYEFLLPLSDRLTDEMWQELLGQGMQPDLPNWSCSFIA